MKRSVIALNVLSVLLLLSSCKSSSDDTQTPAVEPGYTIEVKIAGAPLQQATLAYYYGNALRKISVDSSMGKLLGPPLGDSATASPDLPTVTLFRFQADTFLRKGLYNLSIDSSDYALDIIVNNDQHFVIQTDTSNLIYNLKVEGSEENGSFYHYVSSIRKANEEISEMARKMQDALAGSPEAVKLQESINNRSRELNVESMKILDANPNLFATQLIRATQLPKLPEDQSKAALAVQDQSFAPRYMQKHYWDNIDLGDDRLLRTFLMEGKLEQYTNQLTVQQPDSLIKSIDLVIGKAKDSPEMFRFVVEHFFNKYAQFRQGGLEAIYVHILDTYYTSGDAWWVKKPDA